jgi:hypothetical protein
LLDPIESPRPSLNEMTVRHRESCKAVAIEEGFR